MSKDLLRADEIMIMDLVERRVRELGSGNIAAVPWRNPLSTLVSCERGELPERPAQVLELFTAPLLLRLGL